MNFWIDRGACGYRMDVINLISKDQRFPDAEPALGPDHKYHPGSKYYVNGPRIHEYLQEIKHKVLQKHGSITVGEWPSFGDASKIDEVIRTVRSKTGEINMCFIFDIFEIDSQPGKVRMTLREWSVKDLARAISKWQRAMIERDGWNTVFIENHDGPRSVSRYCDDSDAYREYGACISELYSTVSHQILGRNTLVASLVEELHLHYVHSQAIPPFSYQVVGELNPHYVPENDNTSLLALQEHC